MARASTSTLLSLDEYAKILGLDPLHFCSGFSTVRPEPTNCSDIWFQYDWQDPDKVSREQVAQLLHEAELDLADALGYWPAPVWIEDERVPYPRPAQAERIGYSGRTPSWRWKPLRLKRGQVLYGGRRATFVLNEGKSVEWEALDTDGDGFFETAFFEFPHDCPPEPELCGLKAYFKEYEESDEENCRTDPASTGADPVWEIRPIRAQCIPHHVHDYLLRIWIPVWALFRPQLQEALNARPVNADDEDSYVDQIMLYCEHNDPERQVEFLWGEDLSDLAQAGSWATQPGCFRTIDQRRGLIAPMPATYNLPTQSFTPALWSQYREPDLVRLWYRAGLVSERESTCPERLGRYWAKTLAILATARMDWPLCACTNVQLMADDWRQDATSITKEQSFMVSPDDMSNPFGTRKGEIIAWKRVNSRGRKLGRTAVV